MNNQQNQPETVLSETKSVIHKNNIVYRPAGPWSKNVHRLLNHLKMDGFQEVPQIVDSGFDSQGRETLSYMEGEFVHPGPWSDEGIKAVGRLLRRLHESAASFKVNANDIWQPWFMRDLGSAKRIIGHGDVAPWNMVTRNGLPTALIDWEYAGPVDPMVELARVCWLFPQLHDDDVAARVGLPPLENRARQLRLLVDAYGLSEEERRPLLDLIILVVVCETAQEAIDNNITPDSVGPLWGIAWRSRAAAWILRNRSVLEDALS